MAVGRARVCRHTRTSACRAAALLRRSGEGLPQDALRLTWIRAPWWHLDCNCAKFRGAIVQNVETGNADVRGQLERILATYEEIDRRFGQVGGLGSVVALYEQIRRELARVSYDELDRMTQEIKGIIDALLKMDYELRKVNNLKVAFDAGTAGPGSAG